MIGWFERWRQRREERWPLPQRGLVEVVKMQPVVSDAKWDDPPTDYDG